MTHPHDEFDRAALRAHLENFVDQRDEGGDSFERKTFAAEVALLHDLLKDIGANQELENAGLVFFCNLEPLRLRFHALVDPAPAIGSVNVVNLNADG